jgi:excisionase family DNA binding protein
MSGSKTVSTTAPELPRKVGLTMPQGARLIGCSQRHFYDLAYAGEIPTYLVGGRRFVDEQATDAYVMRCKKPWAALHPWHRQACAGAAEEDQV